MTWMIPLLPMLLPLAAAPQSAPAATGGELNVLSALVGTRALGDSDEPTNDAIQMIDSDPATLWEPDWTEGEQPVVVLQLAEPCDLSAVEVVNSSNEGEWPGISVKKLRLEVRGSAKEPWKQLAELSLKKGSAPQRSAVSAKKARYVRVTLLENYGNDRWWSLGELRVLGARSAARKIDFNGAWETNYGEMRLEQTGERIVGCYGTREKENGLFTVEGSLEGSVFSGTWREESDEGEASVGTMIFALTAEGDLSGVWGRDHDKARDARWDGKRLKATTITCEKPEKGLSAQLAKGRVVLRGILFDTGKDTIKAESIPVLEALSAAMKKDGARRYVVEGHTDDRGGKDYNQKLSEQRAASVKAWLVKSGVPAERLRPAGFGMTRPTMPNDTEAGRLQNRRVEVATEQ